MLLSNVELFMLTDAGFCLCGVVKGEFCGKLYGPFCGDTIKFNIDLLIGSLFISVSYNFPLSNLLDFRSILFLTALPLKLSSNLTFLAFESKTL